MTKIRYILLALVMMMPLGANAATFTFNPAIGSYNAGETFTTSVFVTPAAGETLSAAKISLTYPADKLELVTYTPANGGSILAHVGTNTATAGTIIDNVAFNPAITASTSVATITFKAKTEGAAQLAVAPDAKLLDSTNTDKKTSSPAASYVVSVPAPVVTTTTEETTPPAAEETPATSQESSSSTGSATTQSASAQEGGGAGEGTQDEATTEEDAEATTTDEEVVAEDEAGTSQVAAAASTGLFDGGWKTWSAIAVLFVLGLLLLFFKRRKSRG